MVTSEQETYLKQLEIAKEALRALPFSSLDDDTLLLKKAFDITYDSKILNLYDYPLELQEELKFSLFSILPGLSGSLAFLAIQILAANKIMAINNFPRQREFFAKKCGIAINHLRAPRTIVDSVKTEKGYALSGTLTWASGYGIFDHLVIGFHHKGEEMEAVIPFETQEGMQVGEVSDTFVGKSMNTVNIELKDYHVPFDAIISTKPLGTYTRAKSLSKTIHYALYGLGLGALEMITDTELKQVAIEELEAIKSAFLHTSDGQVMDALRIELFNLVQKIITTGMIQRGGIAILANQRLQQYYRDLIMFNANGLNDTIKSLFRLSFLRES